MDFLSQHAPFIFPALYGVALLVSHFAPDHTIAGKIARWVLSGAGMAKPSGQETFAERNK